MYSHGSLRRRLQKSHALFRAVGDYLRSFDSGDQTLRCDALKYVNARSRRKGFVFVSGF